MLAALVLADSRSGPAFGRATRKPRHSLAENLISALSVLWSDTRLCHCHQPWAFHQEPDFGNRKHIDGGKEEELECSKQTWEQRGKDGEAKEEDEKARGQGMDLTGFIPKNWP